MRSPTHSRAPATLTSTPRTESTRSDQLATAGRSLVASELHRAVGGIDGLDELDVSQLAAASAVAGTHGLVTVTGPAGARKTTMLRAAFRAAGPSAR